MKTAAFILSLLCMSAFIISSAQQTPTTKSIKVGNQEWMSSNLDVSKFRNGELIPEAKSNDDWRKADINKKPAWCYFDNDAAIGGRYGKLYNWFAVVDPRGLAPRGWHVASDGEWKSLADFLGGEDIAGMSMKSASGWDADDNGISGNGNNKVGLACMPGGSRSPNGEFGGTGETGSWWSSTDYSPANMTPAAWSLGLIKDDGGVYRTTSARGTGLSVRCIKD